MEEDYEKTVSIYDAKPKKDYKLVICHKNKHNVISLGDYKKSEITFGRAKDNDIVINSSLVSAHHGKFVLDGALTVIDNNSTNGLFVNGDSTKDYVLSDGDVIKIDNPDKSLDDYVAISVALGDVPEKCLNCKKSVDDKEETEEVKEEPKKDDTIFCAGCGSKVSKTEKFCPSCGTPIGKNEVVETPTPVAPAAPQKKNNAPLFIGLGIGGFVLLIFIVLVLIVVISSSDGGINSSLPPKVDYSLTGENTVVDYILEELDLDFDQVTGGANCYSGVQNRTFNTEKYGVLHTEFSYCKLNGTKTLRIYNSEVDQKLRDPNPGELPELDSKGYIKNSSRSYV